MHYLWSLGAASVAIGGHDGAVAREEEAKAAGDVGPVPDLDEDAHLPPCDCLAEQVERHHCNIPYFYGMLYSPKM